MNKELAAPQHKNRAASAKLRVAAVVPCYRVADHIQDVVERCSRHVDAVYVVDDCCPENSSGLLSSSSSPGLQILRNERNLGVGGATIAGYQAALADGFDIVVKVDGDGQMDADLIPFLISPIAEGSADYTKGNRFFNVQDVKGMPGSRLIGNAALSFLTKLASGYWTIFDPTNGFTAVHARVLERLPLDRISKRYFFESDMLFRLGTIRAHVIDVPMTAMYGSERSNLRPGRMILPFLWKNVANTAKRIFYSYFLRDFSVASVNLLLASVLSPIGVLLGTFFWIRSFRTGVAATSGEVMLAALPLLIAMQLLLSFLAYDVEFTPKRAIHPLLPPANRSPKPRRPQP